MADLSVRDFITKMSIRDGKQYTEEQIHMMSNFDKNLIAFADAGTGKTATCVAGLVTAELFYKIPADEITAMSFTKLATIELKNRHEVLCRKLGIRSKVNFRTLDSMCLSIIQNNYQLLGLDKVSTKDELSVEELANYILDIAEQYKMNINPQKVRTIVYAVRSLNSALIFDRSHVEDSMEFKQTKLSYDDFTIIRSSIYGLNKVLEQIPVGDISLYTLEILTRFPEVSEEWKKHNKIMLVDEFQDMSLLKLRLLSLLTDKLIVVGDMKQQIYGFTGASPEIVSKYKEFYPDHLECQLSQSFRCDVKIAEYAKGLILPNEIGGENFKGVERNGKLEIYNKDEFNLREFVKGIQEEYVANRNVFEKSVMFLFRNNISAIQIAEVLYEFRLPFIIPKYKMAHQIPVIQDLVALAELARNPNNASNLEILNKILPEFRKLDGLGKNPIFQIMKKTGMDFFQIDYNYMDPTSGEHLRFALMEARESYLRGETAGQMFNKLWKAYEDIYLKFNSFMLENEPKYYLNAVKSLVNSKPLQQFLADEIRKSEWINEWARSNEGIRCYTFHASKGTEADIVHIIDADEGVVPNTKKLDRALELNSPMTAARDLRSERCLVFVASTRAKEELHIHHNGTLASLFTTQNKYVGLDRVYKANRQTYDDVTMFTEFYKM